jgi:hypothetical protein
VVRNANESRVGGAHVVRNANVSRVGGAHVVRNANVSRVGGACGPPPPFVAPLVPRCALTSGATPRDVLGRRLRLDRPETRQAPNARRSSRDFVTTCVVGGPVSGITTVESRITDRRKQNRRPSKAESPTVESGIADRRKQNRRPSKAESPTVESGIADRRKQNHRPLKAESPTVENGTARESDGRSHVSGAASTSRGVAPEVSAQRGTSGATNGGGGPQAPPTRLSLWLPTRLSLWLPTRLLSWLPTRLSLMRWR